MTTAIRKLREIEHCCRAAAPLPPPLADWLAASLGKFLSRQCRSIEAAFELAMTPGGVPWWLEEAMRTRDAALRALAKAACPSLPITARARRVAALLARYDAGAWASDRARTDMPAEYAGTLHEAIWRAFKSGAAMPLGERQLRTILDDR